MLASRRELMDSPPPARPLPELPSRKRRRLMTRPDSGRPVVVEERRESPRELSISPSASQSYESSHRYVCSSNVPEDLAPLRREMLVKMADTFGVPDVRERTSANLCILLGTALDKARLMSEFQSKVGECLGKLTDLRRQLDREQVPDFLRSEVEDNLSELEAVYQQAERKFRDINVSADAFSRDVADRIRQCDSELDTISRKFLSDNKRRRRRGLSKLWQK